MSEETARAAKTNKKTLDCKKFFIEFLECLKNSECVRKEEKTLKECSFDPNMSQKCEKLMIRYHKCRRGLVRVICFSLFIHCQYECMVVK